MVRVGFGSAALVALALSASAGEQVATVDRLLGEENVGRKVQPASFLEDSAYLRRVTVDLIGRIPTDEEITRYQAWPKAERRERLVAELLKREQFADKWTVFLGDMLRIRSNADGGAAFLAFVHRALETDMPYDVVCRQLISATGKADLTPEVGFVLGDDADPMALAGVTSQVFLGVRIACAQCHNHPFDVWKRKEFYDLAAFFGKTQKVESRIGMRVIGVFVNETQQTSILWPPEDKAQGKTRTPVKAQFPFKLDGGDGPNRHIARLKELRARLEAERLAAGKKKAGPSVDDLLNDAASRLDKRGPKEELDVAAESRTAAKNLNVEKDIYSASALRQELAAQITDPRNRFFSRNLVNRLWGELMGRGFVNPVDDFREDNPPSHVKTLDYLADEFVASGYDFRTLVGLIVRTQAYQRGHLEPSVSPVVRNESEQAFVAATRRRMLSEALYDSIVQAGHLFTAKHRAGENMITLTQTVQVPVEMKDIKDLNGKKPGKKPVEMASMPAQGGYDLERSIEVDFKAAPAKKNEAVNLEAMEAKSNEEIEAEQMMMRPDGKRIKYITEEVKTVIDDNPRFTSSLRMAAPAPVGHFLRVFGQPERATLDDRRDHSPSMRQALMMLNGKLTNEAARVGALEPIYKLLAADKPDIDGAIRLAYREILTREPTAEEMTEAVTILTESGKPLDGMADLRWALFNCHEFRLLP